VAEMNGEILATIIITKIVVLSQKDLILSSKIGIFQAEMEIKEITDDRTKVVSQAAQDMIVLENKCKIF
jgi:hypothetical protein